MRKIITLIRQITSIRGSINPVMRFVVLTTNLTNLTNVVCEV